MMFPTFSRFSGLEMTADLRDKDLHVLKGTSIIYETVGKSADFSSVQSKVQDFFAQIFTPFTPCIFRFCNFCAI